MCNSAISKPFSMYSSDSHRPIIGISPGFAGPDSTRKIASAGRIVFCDMNYIECTENAQGLPFVLPFTYDRDRLQRYADYIDGLILIGGADVHPQRYGQDLEPTEQEPVLERDEFEFELLEVVMEREKPILAICRGHQVLNIFFGGTLIQDIPSKLGPVHHMQEVGSQSIAHSVTIEPESILKRLAGGATMGVNSFHHQCVDRLADSLRVTARSEEGIVEAFEHQSHPYLHSVQWHPERMRKFPQHQLLFSDFVRACREVKVEVI
jgi:putative glutamine amidotransferase